MFKGFTETGKTDKEEKVKSGLLLTFRKISSQQREMIDCLLVDVPSETLLELVILLFHCGIFSYELKVSDIRDKT